MLMTNRSGRLLTGILLCLLLAFPLAVLAEGLKLLVVLSDATAPYLSFESTLKKTLPSSAHVSVLEHPELLSPDMTQTDLIVAVGMKATEMAVTNTRIPVLAVMIPRAGYENLLAETSGKHLAHPTSAIYLDQPWRRRIDFWRAALPGRKRIGLLHSPDKHFDVSRLRQDVARRGGSLVAQPVLSADELFAGLEKVLASSDVLLAIPDSLIYTSNNIRSIMLSSYRHGVPLIGLSQAYVNAGALCAIFSTPEQLAVQASAAVMEFSQAGKLPQPQYPATFTTAVNQQVARSLGIDMPSEEVIRSRMDKAPEEGQ